ncbi:MAG: undecaprenyl-diphosphatase UppP [Syntrophomonadaceae bacterium]
MVLWHAIILGIVQGLGEFLPISSSAHLWILPWLFKWPYAGLTFDIALHVGTLIAVVAYFWRDWWVLVISGVRDIRSQEGKIFWYLVVATIPGALAGFLLEDYAETLFRQPVLIGIALIIMGAILFWADRQGSKVLKLDSLDFRTAIVIGLSQALAIIPGVSRSGITMSAGLLTGLTRESAARFSFLLSTPIIFGAALVKVPKLLANPAMMDLSFFIGVVVSCLVGLLSIGFLLRFLQTRNFLPFAWYRFALGALVIIVALLR